MNMSERLGTLVICANSDITVQGFSLSFYSSVLFIFATAETRQQNVAKSTDCNIGIVTSSFGRFMSSTKLFVELQVAIDFFQKVQRYSGSSRKCYSFGGGKVN